MVELLTQDKTMKKTRNTIHILLSVIMLTMTFMTSCVKDYYNGHLDGMWQVMEVTGADGTTSAPDPRIYMSFEFDVVLLSRYDDKVAYGNMHYDKSAGKISMDFPYNNKGEELEMMAPWGIYTPEIVAKIEKLDSKTLILKMDNSRIVCRKF